MNKIKTNISEKWNKLKGKMKDNKEKAVRTLSRPKRGAASTSGTASTPAQDKENLTQKNTEEQVATIVEETKKEEPKTTADGTPVIDLVVTEKAQENVPHSVVEGNKDAAASGDAEKAKSEMCDPVELYTRGICPFTESVRIALAFKGIKYKLVKFTPDNPPPEWFKTASPSGTVPLLKLGTDEYISDSSDMIEWAEKTVPEPAFDAGLDIKKWVDLIKKDFTPTFPKVMGSPNPKMQAELRPRLKSATEQLTEHLKTERDGPFFMGKEYTLVDILLTPFIRRIPLIEFFRGFKFADQTFVKYGWTIEAHENFKDVSMPVEKLKGILIKMLPKMPPMSGGRLQHISIRRHFANNIKLSKELLEAEEMSDEEAVQKAKDIFSRIETLMVFIDEHSKFEEDVVYPIFEEKNPGSTARAHGEHEHEVPILLAFKEEVHAALETAQEAKEGGAETVKNLLKPILPKLEEMATNMTEHMAGEEQNLFPMTRQLGDKEDETFRKIYYHCSHVRELLLPYLMELLEPHERMQYMHNIDKTVREGDPDQWKLCQRLLKESLPQAEWDDLVLRLPNIGL